MLKDAFEDYKRHQSDGEENNKTALVFNKDQKSFNQKYWKDIRVGEILKIVDEEFIPCDIMLIKAVDAKGVCFVETKNLDGETNLKIKNVQKDINEHFSERSEQDIAKIDGKVLCERPNNAIYKFEGTAEFPNLSNKIPLNAENLLLRGSSLRNTEYVYGVCIFSGHDTKVMKNSAISKYKFSQLEKHMNKSLGYVFALQFILGVIGSAMGASWIANN